MMESFADFSNPTISTAKAPVDEEGKPIERWAPLGANDSPDLSVDENASVSDSASSDKLRSITEEQEILNSALLLITSHCAQVQFRLEQVLQADPEEKELLLRDLEQFAWKGVPDLHALRSNQKTFQVQIWLGYDSAEESPDDQQRKQMSHMIDQLKSQLHDLEQFAYKSGEIQQPPTQNVLEKQRLVLEELDRHLDLNVSEFPSLTEKEIRERVNAGLTQLTKPIKTNEALVDQLKTQIIDLERFIDFLHDEGAPDSVIGKALEAFRRYQQDQRNRTSPTIQHERAGGPDCVEGGYQIGLSRRRQNRQNSFNPSEESVLRPKRQFDDQKMEGLTARVLTMLQVFATMQLASRRARMHQQAERYAKSAGARKLSQINGAKSHHWGDIRARLEMAVETVLEKAERLCQVRQQHNRQTQASPNSSSNVSNEEARQPSDNRVPTAFSKARLRDVSSFYHTLAYDGGDFRNECQNVFQILGKYSSNA
ncbi:RUN domain-containing protein 1 [Taenia solium]|eukprot:TsM_001072300 transcript=TsM_001072300 gene=TsM_001072300